ncbi:MAG: hypothetical protein HOI23_09210, partial [Deltaproteobacteria bacterium]|nr:hypothetical protein [Deltaproteobacteria bacterium]
MADTLAEAFVSSGLIEREDILDALGVQRSRGGTLDTALLEADLLNERDILDVLEQHYKLESANRGQIERVDMGIVETFPRHYAETYRMAPLRISGNSIRLLVATPPHPRVLERIQKRIKLQPVAVVAVEARLHDAMRRLYSKEPPPRFATLLESLAQRPDTPPKTTFPVPELASPPEELATPQEELVTSSSPLSSLEEASTAATTPAVLIEQLLGACSEYFQTVVHLSYEDGTLSGQGGRRGTQEIAYPLIVDDWPELLVAMQQEEAHELKLVHTHSEHVLDLPTSTPALAIALRAHQKIEGLILGFGPDAHNQSQRLQELVAVVNQRLDQLISEPEEEKAQETLPEPEEEKAQETLPKPEEEKAQETLPEPEEEQAQETLPEP